MNIKDLYPQYSDNELKEIERRLTEYAVVVLSIYEDLLRDPQAYARFKALTAKPSNFTMNKDKVSPHQQSIP